MTGGARRVARAALVSLALLPASASAERSSDAAPAVRASEAHPAPLPPFRWLAPSLTRAALPPRATGFRDARLGAIRGITVGPIESSLHPDKGYGSAACARTMSEARRMGATWVSLTPFGRVWDLTPTGVSRTFELDYPKNRLAVRRAIEQAHEEGLQVMLVPHLWVETGGWRAEIDPATDADWESWARSYREFLLGWATLAAETGVEMLSVGVELRSWLTTERAPSFSAIVNEVRSVYPGLLTYAANWDDVDRTVILGQLDVIGINAFYPLAEKEGASRSELMHGGREVAEKLDRLARSWNKPVMFTEFGYTTRKDPAIRPWEWPDDMKNVAVDEVAQAEAYYSLLSAFVDQETFAGFFVWRLYADPDDMSQEAEWGFSPRSKVAELVLRDAFASHWAADGPRSLGDSLVRYGTWRIGTY
jgi:hypothetical protein